MSDSDGCVIPCSVTVTAFFLVRERTLKSRNWTSRDWTTRDHIARVDIARPENAAPDQTEVLEHSGAE